MKNLSQRIRFTEKIAQCLSNVETENRVSMAFTFESVDEIFSSQIKAMDHYFLVACLFSNVFHGKCKKIIYVFNFGTFWCLRNKSFEIKKSKRLLTCFLKAARLAGVVQPNEQDLLFTCCF